MRNLIAALVVVVLGGIPLPNGINLAWQPQTSRLQLTTSIVREKSCSPSHLSLELRFTFRNVGPEPIILDKRSFVTRSLVSQSQKAAIAKDYEAQSRADLFDDTFPASPKDMSDFAVVEPGKSYDLQTEQTRVSLLIDDGTPRTKGYLRAGNHFLQIEVATWTYLDDAEQSRLRWKTKGLLWSKGLTSQPMPFLVEQSRPISKCS